MSGLADAPRPGRPPVYDLQAQLLIVATVTQQTPEADSHWTHRLLAEHLDEPLGISASQIGRILCSLDLKPHRRLAQPPPGPGIHQKGAGGVRAVSDTTRGCGAVQRG